MKIINVNDVKTIETPHKVDVRKLYDYDNAQVMHITLKQGEALKPHITPVDVFFFVLEGVVDVLVGEETISVEKNNLVESPRNIVHCLSNNSTEITKILVVKAPKQTTQTKVL